MQIKRRLICKMKKHGCKDGGKCCGGKCKEEKIKLYFCPKCESFNVKYVFGITNVLGMIPMQKCHDCGLKAYGFPILETTKEEILKRAEKLKKKKEKKKITKKKDNKKGGRKK